MKSRGTSPDIRKGNISSTYSTARVRNEILHEILLKPHPSRLKSSQFHEPVDPPTPIF